jgi:hypothetical protein
MLDAAHSVYKASLETEGARKHSEAYGGLVHSRRESTGKDSRKTASVFALASIGLVVAALSSVRQAYGNVIMTGLPTTTIVLTEGQSESLTLTITNSTTATVSGRFSVEPPAYLNGDASDSVAAQIKNNFCSSSLENLHVGLAAGASCTFQLSLSTPNGTGETGAELGLWKVKAAGRASKGRTHYKFADAADVQVHDDPPASATEPGTPTLVLLVLGALGLDAFRKKRLVAQHK